MGTVHLSTLTRECDRLLRSDSFEDWPGAWNGLQVENRGVVTRLAAAVDASLATVRQAIEQKADLLLVHHGLFWGTVLPWTGKRHELLRALLEGNLAVYSAHLPLDAHPHLGNNAQLCEALGWTRRRPFFPEKGRDIGFQVRTRLSRADLEARLAKILGRSPLTIPAGPDMCRRIGVVSGGAGQNLVQAARAGLDTFITGEGPHWTYALAEEHGINVIYGGHYATETFGVKALARHLSRKYHLPWTFIDHPTGL